MRDNLLLAGDSYDEDQLCNDLVEFEEGYFYWLSAYSLILSLTWFIKQATPPVVTWYLEQKGLPLEVALEVLDHVEYIPRRRLPISDDPLHPENAEELRKYLKYCWRLLIGRNVLVKGTGGEIN
ncbi:hypothetical protein VE02_06501 [Pseudogymnoascus sp. 03VT05]|nr:hypothetical protein VE02_06501 [Pseudogymnoascus sp. 03VT05]